MTTGSVSLLPLALLLPLSLVVVSGYRPHDPLLLSNAAPKLSPKPLHAGYAPVAEVCPTAQFLIQLADSLRRYTPEAVRILISCTYV